MIRTVPDWLRRKLESKAKAWLYRRRKTIINVGSNGVKGVYLPADLRDLLPPKPTCFDIGANTGQTIDLLRLALSEPRIFSFEPAMRTFELLQRKYDAPDVKLFQLAMGSLDARLEFINYEGSNLSSFLEIDRVSENRFKAHAEKGRERVSVTTVDSFAARHEVEEIHLLKSDTQGYELEVLKGASRLFDEGRIHTVLVELNFVPMYKHQAPAGEIIKYLESKNQHLVDFYDKVRQGNAIAWCEGLFCRRW